MIDVTKPYVEVEGEITQIPGKSDLDHTYIDAMKQLHDSELGVGASDAVPANVFTDMLTSWKHELKTIKESYPVDGSLTFQEVVQLFQRDKDDHDARLVLALKNAYESTLGVNTALTEDFFDRLALALQSVGADNWDGVLT